MLGSGSQRAVEDAPDGVVDSTWLLQSWATVARSRSAADRDRGPAHR
jgi:hypothetical protein